MDRQKLEEYFRREGLLVRTTLLSSLGNNFVNINVSIDNAREAQNNNSKYYGPKRRWSIAHSNIKPNFFMMGEETNSLIARHLAIMIVPSLVDWTRYLAISSKDASSGFNIGTNDKLMDEETAKRTYYRVLNEIKGSSLIEQNQNSEISTLGFDIKAFCGLLFHGTEEWWNANIGRIKEQLKILKKDYKINKVDVYTYNSDNKSANKTVLTYKETIELQL